MSVTRRLVIVSDVGGSDRRHVGDEAMFEANLASFRRLIPDAVVTAVSRDSGIAARYGIDTVHLPAFSRDPSAGAERATMLERLSADARNGRGEGTVIEAIANSDGLVISGGGNLSSSWPDLLYERAALLRLARIFEKPAVVLGQTIGTRLGDLDRQLLAETLPYARFVGARELPTAALLLGLGVPAERIWYQCDDAMFLGDDVPPLPDDTPVIAVTVDPQMRAAGEELFGALVNQLRELAQKTGARLILVPHEFGDEAHPSDLAEARILKERLGLAQVEIAEGLSALDAKRVAGEAALVISSRYHPIVFGLGAGVPAIGIYADEYCRVKLQGALAHADLERWALTYGEVAKGALLEAGLELWSARQVVSDAILSRREAWLDESRRRWDAILRALDPSAMIPPADPSMLFGRPLFEIAPALATALDMAGRAMENEHASFEQLSSRFATLERYAISLAEELSPRRSLKRWWAAARRRV